MSIQVEPDELGDALRVYRFAYLITVGDGGRSHVVAVSPHLTYAGEEPALVVRGLGPRSLANLAVNQLVTLVWPPAEPAGHSLIVDGVATVHAADPGHAGTDGAPAGDGDAECRIAVGRAVLHRPAPSTSPVTGDSCPTDCVEIKTGQSSD